VTACASLRRPPPPQEKYHASASKPVYKSLIVGVKKHAVQCSMADLEKYMNAGA